jgi:predicted Rossmann fold nucleotide-binding protein DprA/Smf involved in DNA uptake
MISIIYQDLGCLIRIMSEETLKKVYNALKDEPQTPNEIADKSNLNQKTVQGALLELVNTKKNIKWKKVGRYRLFWKVK